MSRPRTAVRPAPPARAGRSQEPDVSRFHSMIVVTMVCGSMLAMLLIASGLVTLDPQDVRADAGATAPASATPGPDQSAHEATGASADLEVSAEHLGNLQVRVEVRVTMNEQRRALQQANVEATLDMIQMPGAHTQGPLAMPESEEEPGLYTLTVAVPMLGDYDIQIHVHEPVHAETTHRLAVEVLRPDGSDG